MCSTTSLDCDVVVNVQPPGGSRPPPQTVVYDFSFSRALWEPKNDSTRPGHRGTNHHSGKRRPPRLPRPFSPSQVSWDGLLNPPHPPPEHQATVPLPEPAAILVAPQPVLGFAPPSSSGAGETRSEPLSTPPTHPHRVPTPPICPPPPRPRVRAQFRVRTPSPTPDADSTAPSDDLNRPCEVIMIDQCRARLKRITHPVYSKQCELRKAAHEYLHDVVRDVVRKAAMRGRLKNNLEDYVHTGHGSSDRWEIVRLGRRKREDSDDGDGEPHPSKRRKMEHKFSPQHHRRRQKTQTINEAPPNQPSQSRRRKRRRVEEDGVSSHPPKKSRVQGCLGLLRRGVQALLNSGPRRRRRVSFA